MVYRIMSFDGGGIRGIYTAQLLAMLAQEVDLFKNVDLYIGTSTGSLIALGLALKYSPEQLVGLYQQFAPMIFSMSQQSATPEYTTHPLKQALETQVFAPTATLGDLPKHVVIPVFKLYDQQLGRWNATCFHNFDLEVARQHTLVDVALSACAAPLLFPSYQGCIDGGVFVHNPSMFGLCQALKHKMGSLEKMRLCSFGTTVQPMSIKKDLTSKEWMECSPELGYPFFSLVTEGAAEIPHEQCEQILGSHYHRLNTLAPVHIDITSAAEVPRLVELAQRVPKDHPQIWKSTVAWLKEHF